jgi:hypothetical protein
MKGKHLFQVLYITTAILFCGCNNYVEKALKYAGDNRPELEAVLDHYKDNPEKLAAAKFLIENMPDQLYFYIYF